MKVQTNKMKSNGEDYSFYALMATKSTNNNFQIWNTNNPSRGKDFQTEKYMKYGHNKEFKISQYTAAAMPCEANEGVHQQNKK